MSRSPSVTRRHFLELSPLSPWERSNSDPSLLSPRPGRRRFGDGGCQFRSHLGLEGALDFRPESRAAFSPPPPGDARASRFARGSLPRRLHQTRDRSPSTTRRLSSSRDDFFGCDDDDSLDTSETRAQFDWHQPLRPWALQDFQRVASSRWEERPAARPPLIRHRTELQLPVGRMDATPEYRAAFVEFPRQRPVVRRPPQSLFNGATAAAVRPNSLELQRPATALDVRPEYQECFVDFPRSRPQVPRPPLSLTPDGPWFGHSAEYGANFVDFPRHRPEVRRHIDSLRGGAVVSPQVSTKFLASKKLSPSKPSAGIELDKSPMDTSPEYRENFRDFPRSRPQTKRPPPGIKTEGEFCDQNEYKENYKDSPRARPRTVRPPASLKPEGDLLCSPEYKENYKNHPRKRPETKKPPNGLKSEGEMAESPGEYRESYKDFPRQRPRTPRPCDSLKSEGGVAETAEYRSSFVDHPRQRPEVPRPEGTLRPRGPWLGRFPEYRAAFIDLPRQRPVTPRPLSHLNSDALGGGYSPHFGEGAARSGRASSAGPPGHAHQRSPSPQKRGRTRKKAGAEKQRPPLPPKSPPKKKEQQPMKPIPSPKRIDQKELPYTMPQHVKCGEPDKLNPEEPHAYKTPRSPVRIAPSAVSAYRVLDLYGVAPPMGDDADKGREPGDGKWGSGWLARHSRA